MAAGLAAVTCCGAAETNGKDANEPTIYLGGGAVVSTRSYIGVDPRVYPVPLFAYEGKRLYLRGVVGGYRLLMGEGWSVGPVVQPRFDGYDQEDSSALKGMDERHWSLDAGVAASWLTKIGLFGLSAVTDALGKHKGQELEFSYTILFNLAGFDFIPSAGIRWKSQDLVDYYYGVQPSEVRPGRPAYEGQDALDPFARLAVRRKLTDRWSLLAAVQYEWLDDAITDSPIVDANYDASFLVGALYSW
jgi:outer membrane protein